MGSENLDKKETIGGQDKYTRRQFLQLTAALALSNTVLAQNDQEKEYDTEQLINDWYKKFGEWQSNIGTPPTEEQIIEAITKYPEDATRYIEDDEIEGVNILWEINATRDLAEESGIIESLRLENDKKMKERMEGARSVSIDTSNLIGYDGPHQEIEIVEVPESQSVKIIIPGESYGHGFLIEKQDETYLGTVGHVLYDKYNVGTSDPLLMYKIDKNLIGEVPVQQIKIANSITWSQIVDIMAQHSNDEENYKFGFNSELVEYKDNLKVSVVNSEGDWIYDIDDVRPNGFGSKTYPALIEKHHKTFLYAMFKNYIDSRIVGEQLAICQGHSGSPVIAENKSNQDIIFESINSILEPGEKIIIGVISKVDVENARTRVCSNDSFTGTLIEDKK